MSEFITGITNLAMLISSVPCILLYRGYRNGVVWMVAFGAVGVTSLAGTFLHILAVGAACKLALWIILYTAFSAFLGTLTLAAFTTINLRGILAYSLSVMDFALTFFLLLFFKLTQDIFSYVAVIVGALLPVTLLFYVSVRDLVKNKNKLVWLTFAGSGGALLLTVLFTFVKFSVPVGASEFNQGAAIHLAIGVCMVLMALGTRSMLTKREPLNSAPPSAEE